MADPDYATQAVRSADTILLEVSIIGKDTNGRGIAGNSQWEGYTKGHRKCWSLPESASYGGVSRILATVPPDGMAIQQELEIRQKYKLHRKHILDIFTCFCTLKREVTSTGNSLFPCEKCFWQDPLHAPSTRGGHRSVYFRSHSRPHTQAPGLKPLLCAHWWRPSRNQRTTED